MRRIRDGCRFARGRVGHRERLQKVVDLVPRYAETKRVPIDLGVTLEIRHAVAIDNDASKGRVTPDE